MVVDQGSFSRFHESLMPLLLQRTKKGGEAAHDRNKKKLNDLQFSHWPQECKNFAPAGIPSTMFDNRTSDDEPVVTC